MKKAFLAVTISPLWLTLVGSPALATKRHDASGGAYVALGGGIAQPVKDKPASGKLAGAVPIPFAANLELGPSWSARVALGYEEARSIEVTGGGPRFRIEGEYILARIKRRSFEAGALLAEPNDEMRAEFGMANAQVRMIGNSKTAIWLGGGVGIGTMSSPDASQKYGCRCLTAAKGSGLAYQGKISAELMISNKSSLFFDVAGLRTPSMSTKQVPEPALTYEKMWISTAGAGFRFRF